MEEHRPGGIFKVARRHRIIDQADPARLAGVDAPAGQHHLQGRQWPDQLGQADSSAEAGMNPQLYLGKTELGFRGVRGDPVAAGKRQLQASPQAEAVNETHGGEGESFETFEYPLAALDERQGLPFIGQAGKFRDVRAGDEAVRLAGADNKTGGELPGKRVQDQGELFQSCPGEGVDFPLRMVEGEPGYPVIVPFYSPVAVCFPVMRHGTPPRSAQSAWRHPGRRRCRGLPSRAWRRFSPGH